MGAIAIVGIACQFPGARDLAELHDLTLAGWRMFRPVPALPGRMHYAALLDGWPSPDDPGEGGGARKLAAETIALALTDATGLRRAPGLNGSRRDDVTGLFLAATAPDAAEIARRETGIGMISRLPQISYLDSLHAIADACAALETGVLDVALAGGVELGVDPRWLARLEAAGDLGTQEMRVYDAEPAGLFPGNGCGIVALMRSVEARAAGLPVYAEIVGHATLPANPEPAGLLNAYTQARVDPGDIHLIEGHGLGTAAGDLAELTAFARLRQGGTVTAALGAVSANIGYTRTAAGAASLIKTVAALVAGTIPPGTGTVRPHRLIESGEARLRLPAGPEPWPGGTRLAAVNSLGAADGASGGVHLVLRREPDHGGRGRRGRTAAAKTATPSGPAPRTDAPLHGKHAAPGGGWLAQRTPPGGPGDGSPGRGVGMVGATYPLAAPANGTAGAPGAAVGKRREVGEWRGVSGRREMVVVGAGEVAGEATVFALCGAERAAMAATLDVVAGSAMELGDADLHNLAWHLAVAAQRAAERGAPLRVTVTAATPGQLAAQARRAAQILREDRSIRENRSDSKPATMTIEPGIAISPGATGAVCLVFPGLAESQQEHAALLTGSLDALRVLDRLGVKATSAVGYSLGEITGLVWAGCLPSAEAARLAAQRARVLLGCASPGAAMARVTAADTVLAQRLCARHGLHIAAYESADTHLLAGPGTGIRDLAVRGAEGGIAVEVLATRGAPHSPAMASCAAPFRAVTAETPFAPPRRPLISTITGRVLTPADDIADLLAGQLARPVLFAQALGVAARAADLLVVAGRDANPASPSSLAAMAAAAGTVPAICVPRDCEAALTQAVATLYAAGAIKDLRMFMPRRNRPRRLAAVPAVPTPRTPEADQPSAMIMGRRGGAGGRFPPLRAVTIPANDP
ncbi:MAG: acyltransferase domain-containing protein [Streptosporangiaceae bacterium]|nr:acyltransferase domain-containing protein [Streptosporangiaceae bacterium]